MWEWALHRFFSRCCAKVPKHFYNREYRSDLQHPPAHICATLELCHWRKIWESDPEQAVCSDLFTLFIRQRTGERSEIPKKVFCFFLFNPGTLSNSEPQCLPFMPQPTRDVERERNQTLCSSCIASICMSHSRELVWSFQLTFGNCQEHLRPDGTSLIKRGTRRQDSGRQLCSINPPRSHCHPPSPWWWWFISHDLFNYRIIQTVTRWSLRTSTSDAKHPEQRCPTLQHGDAM